MLLIWDKHGFEHPKRKDQQGDSRRYLSSSSMVNDQAMRPETAAWA
ncbi:hypothetical protein [Sodalis-like endosymbiont of Proechinophthirus fluctus]|nr:hypothetical protein [Sodalis-like endosymbiont of Proechinophthirus fluctus]